MSHPINDEILDRLREEGEALGYTGEMLEMEFWEKELQRNPKARVLEVESWRRHPGRRILEKESQRNPGGGVLEV